MSQETSPSPTSPRKRTGSKKRKGAQRKQLTNGLILGQGNESTLPIPKLPKPDGRPGESRKQAALARLKISQKELSETKAITTVLQGIPKWRKRAFDAMRFSENPIIRKFLACYDRIPLGDQNHLPLEAVAIAAEVEPAYLLGEILLAMSEFSVASVKVIGIGRHPEVMKKTVEGALEGGVRQQEMVHTMLGALPKNGGSIFIGKFFGGKSSEAQESDAPPEKFEDDLDVIFPDVSLMQERVQPMRQKLLETRK